MIHVAHRALDILACIVQRRKEELPMCDTFHALSLNHSTCCNILKTLMERGCVHTPREEWKGIANETSPVRTLKEIKKTGIAIQASKAMIMGIAKAGKVVACLAVFLLGVRFSEEKTETILEAIHLYATRLSQDL